MPGSIGCSPRGAIVVLGGILIHLSLGTYYTFGNVIILYAEKYFVLCLCWTIWMTRFRNVSKLELQELQQRIWSQKLKKFRIRSEDVKLMTDDAQIVRKDQNDFISHF